MATWLQKRMLAKNKRKRNEKTYQKPTSTRAWGKGINWVVKMYPDPYPGQVYLSGYQVSHTHANP